MWWLAFHSHYAKNFKTFQKKVFQCPRWMRKNLIPRNSSWRVATETWDASCFCKVYWKNNSVLNTCAIMPLKRYFPELNRCIFQISPKYIKLVIPKILFILVLFSFNFYFKITWPPLTKKKFLTNENNSHLQLFVKSI